MLANEVTRYRAVLDSLGVDTELPSRIRASIEEIRQAQDAPEPLSDQVTIRTRREDPEVETSQARVIAGTSGDAGP
ncbi:ABC transporter [Cutibacterium acnes JCM 18920]|nr:ABC transporter [Cutibacterium acnes JCM 18920]